jgi:hypothetical protein
MDDHHDHGDDDGDWRVTAPMQDFTTSQVGTGIAVALVGIVLVFGVPLLLG